MKNRISYFLSESWRGIRQNGWMSIASVGVVSLTLLLFGLFVLLSFNIDHIATEMESQVEIIAFLDLDLATESEQQIRNELLIIPEIAAVEYISKDDALDRLSAQLGDKKSLLDGYPDELGYPLPASFEIRTVNPEQVPDVAKQVEAINGISEANYGAGIVETLLDATKMARLIGTAFMLLLAASATFLIAHTIRLTIYVRRREIMIMKYVGATNWFIRWPFMAEGFFLGVIGSVLPIFLLSYIYQYALTWTATNIAIVELIPYTAATYDLWLYLFPLGVILGGLGSSLSLSRYLNV